MSEEIIKTVKILLKDEGKIIILLKKIAKTEKLNDIRDKNKKITPEYHFCDGDDLIDFELEKDYEIGDIIDDGKVYVKSSKKSEDNNELEKSDSVSKNTDKENNEFTQLNKVEIEQKKTNLNQDLLDFIEQRFSNLNDELKQKLLKILEENYIKSLNDLLNLNRDDFAIFELPPIFKKKLTEEINKLKPKEELTESEKKLIKNIFKQDLSPDILFESLGASNDPDKQEKINNFYFSLKKPVKPIPKDLKKLIVKTSEDVPLPCFKYPVKQFTSKRYYTLLVMGETGSGKTTLLDAFVNYLADINYEDPWRYKLVDENHIKDVPPGESQTSLITSYYVNYEREIGEEINIRIVDTPGLGDTGGVEKDNEIIKQFENFFQETLDIDFILITVKASTTRWTHSSQYVYDRVQEIFGKDAKDRFMLMCTFADDKKPLALKTLNGKIHFEEYFCFNNSALYTPIESSNSTTKTYWNLGMNNVKRFFEIILKKNLPPLSLKLSKKVMLKRSWLFQHVKSSQQIINEGFKMLDNSKELLDEIKRHKDLIDKNGCFKTKQKNKIPRKVTLNGTYQFCDNCKVMCCQVCKWPPNSTYSQCSYFSGGRPCPCCPGKCIREAHVRANDYITYDEIEEEVIIDAKKAAYEEGQKGLSYSDRLLNETIEKMRKEGEQIIKHMKEIKSSLEELDKIALKPRVLTNVEYFDQMIDLEKKQKKAGFQKRIAGLEMMRNRAKQLNTMSKTDDISQLFPSFNNVINELKNKSKTSCLIF